MLVPIPAGAQQIGVVTDLRGGSKLVRAADATVTPLQLGLPLDSGDLISSGEQAIVQFTLGDKASVTLRERTLVQLAAARLQVRVGQVAVVAQGRANSPECLDLRTPNAIGRVCRTTLIADVYPSIDERAPDKCPFTSIFTLLSGSLQATVLDRATGEPGAPWTALNPGEQLTITGCAPPPAPRVLPPDQLGNIGIGFGLNPLR